ncbi:hypothetical protein [Terricaulis sp.]|uniref:hypothetical protein n=1 Tax=Terricaulis sp. TaxID=2768686 RepID=UPI0037849A41
MKVFPHWLTGCFAAALLSVGACATSTAPPSASVSQIVSTTSFGMCVGYCSTRLEISESGAVLVRSARGGRGGAELPDQRFTTALNAGEWHELSRLAANARIDSLPERIGCPDCADGGAESLSIGARTITFDYGASIAEAQPLLERVRALRARMTPTE